MHQKRAALLLAAAFSLPVWGQATDWFDGFSSPELDARWSRDVSKSGRMGCDATRQVLVLGGKENVYNHIETDLPADVSLVQVDMNNVSDPSASWSPGLILYWGPEAHLRVMLSLHYGLRLELAPGAGVTALAERLRPVPDTWYRLRLTLEADRVVLAVEQPGAALAETVDVKRLPEWHGPCRLILGKGYMPRQGGNPDFDNDYGRGDRGVAVHLDNVVVGRPADLEPRLAASLARARVEGEQDAEQLRVALWPNVLSERTRDTVWFAQGAYQRVCFIYENRDAAHSAKRVRLEVEASEHLASRDVIAGGLACSVQTTRENGLTRITADFPATFVIPADLHGVDRRGGDQPGWFSWPTSLMLPPVFVHFQPEGPQEGVIRARLLREGRSGPWTQANALVLPPLPPLPSADRRHLGLSLWEGTSLAPACPQGRELLARQLGQYVQVGLKRVHVHAGHTAVFETARQLGIHTNLASWWHYSAQCPPDVLPSADEEASVPNQRYTTFCPEVIATGTGTYGRFLETVTARMQESAADGFMLDYECRPPLCYDERCRQAFARFTGIADATWPEDVRKEGRYYRRWIEFRCDQGARYVKAIGEAARRARPDCPLQAWVAGYDYNHSIESAQIDISKAAAYLTEPEVPHYTLPATSGDLWIKDAGIASVEAGLKTVQDSLNVVRAPVVFCSSIIYPLGAATAWSDPQILHAQMLAMIGQGVRGISLWGGHDDGAVDGRYLHRLATWNAVLAAAGPFLWDGTRDDGAATVRGADPERVRRYVWRLKDRAFLLIVNLGEGEEAVSLDAVRLGSEAHGLLDGRSVDLSQPLRVPALDAVMLVTTRHDQEP